MITIITTSSRQIRTTLLSLCTTLVVGCAAQQTTPDADAGSVSAGSADQLMVVDCLLPGKIRQLGRDLTYLTAPRPVKTTASRCEIRGGEYTKYDRANFATALKVWLPLARDGDAQAQTYVGEIYEKGLGLESDHALAAKWYREAADQGYSRAQINLGFLYESGLGVERDLTRAMNLYRAASGFDEGELEYVSSIEAAHRVATRQELIDLQQKVEELERVNAELKQEQRELDSARSEVTELRSTIEQRRAFLASAPLSPATQSIAAVNLASTLTQLEGATGALDAARKRQRQLISQLDRQQDETNETRRQFAIANAELNEKSRELSAKEQEIERLTERVARLEVDSARDRSTPGERATLNARLTEERAEVERLRGELQRLRSSQSDSSRAIERELEQAETREQALRQQLDAEAAQVAALQTQLADHQRRYDAELQALRGKLETARAEQNRLGGRLAEAELETADKESEIEELKRLSAERLAEARALERQLIDSERQLELRQADAAEAARLTADAEIMRTKLETARDEQRRLSERIMEAEIDATLELAALEETLRERETTIEQQRRDIADLQNRVTRTRASLQDKDIEKVNDVVPTGPVIEIIEPPVLVSRGKTLTLSSPAGVQDMEVIGRVEPTDNLLTFKINGRSQTLNENGIFQHRFRTGAVPSLRLVAVSDNGQRTDLEVDVLDSALTTGEAGTPESAIDPDEIDFGAYHALIIGNNSYANFHDLRSAENDAIAMERLLRERYGYETELLLNATRYQILSALNRKRDTLTDKDNLLIYYAGHGELSNSKGYWMPVDAEPDNTSNWISNSAITDLVDSMSAKHIMVIADSCYSGSLSRTSLTRLQPGMTSEQKLEWYRLVTSLKVRTVLSSGGVKPVLDSTGNSRHSLFAQALLDELGAMEGVIEAYDLFIKVQSRVKSEARKLDLDQNPQYSPIKHAGHESGEYLFVSNATRVTLDSDPGERLAAHALISIGTGAQAAR